MSEESSREAILRAARDLFTTKGFANTAVREICQEAGVTAPVLYYYFGSKEGLFEAVVEQTLTLDGFYNQLSGAVEAATGPWDRLRAFVSTYLLHFPGRLLNPGLHLESSTKLHGTSLRQYGAGLEAIYQLAREILQAGIVAGEFREVDVDTAAACLVGTVDSFIRAQFFLDVEYDMENVTENIVDLYARGLTATSGPVPA